MQYTDNEAALIGGYRPGLVFSLLPPPDCIRRTEGFLYPRAGASAHRASLCCRSHADPKGLDISDADLPSVQRSTTRPDGRQPENNSAAAYSSLISISVKSQDKTTVGKSSFQR